MKKEVGVKNIEVNHRSTLKVLATTRSIATMLSIVNKKQVNFRRIRSLKVNHQFFSTRKRE